MSNIIYTICCYDSTKKEFENLLFNTTILSIKEYAKRYNYDLKIINYIPTEIEKLIKDNMGDVKHAFKAWTTKFWIINDFYNSKYENMIYLDCDMYFKDYNSNPFNVPYKYPLLARKKTKPIYKKLDPHISIPYHYSAGLIILNKAHKFNIQYNDITDLWNKNRAFLREEYAISHFIANHNINILPIKFKQIPTLGSIPYRSSIKKLDILKVIHKKIESGLNINKLGKIIHEAIVTEWKRRNNWKE